MFMTSSCHPHDGTGTAAQDHARVGAGRPGLRSAGAAGPVRVPAAGAACSAWRTRVFALAGPSLLPLALPFVLAGVAIGCVEIAEHTAATVTCAAGADHRWPPGTPMRTRTGTRT